MKEQKFWRWFEDYKAEYFKIDSQNEHHKEFLLNELLNELHKYCDKLYFQIGGDRTKEYKELIITAEGNTKYFDEVERLVSCAPYLQGWKVIAFKQPKGVDFVTNYEGLILDPKKMWFLPLNNENYPTMIGIRVCIENYNHKQADHVKDGIYQVIDTMLGEKRFAKDVDYLEFDDLSGYDLENDGLIELIELPEYIDWKKNKVAH